MTATMMTTMGEGEVVAADVVDEAAGVLEVSRERGEYHEGVPPQEGRPQGGRGAVEVVGQLR